MLNKIEKITRKYFKELIHCEYDEMFNCLEITLPDSVNITELMKNLEKYLAADLKTSFRVDFKQDVTEKYFDENEGKRVYCLTVYVEREDREKKNHVPEYDEDENLNKSIFSLEAALEYLEQMETEEEKKRNALKNLEEKSLEELEKLADYYYGVLDHIENDDIEEEEKEKIKTDYRDYLINWIKDGLDYEEFLEQQAKWEEKKYKSWQSDCAMSGQGTYECFSCGRTFLLANLIAERYYPEVYCKKCLETEREDEYEYFEHKIKKEKVKKQKEEVKIFESLERGERIETIIRKEEELNNIRTYLNKQLGEEEYMVKFLRKTRSKKGDIYEFTPEPHESQSSK